jgi:hypothetical protein
MAYAGSRTKNVGFWMLPADEARFDEALRDRCPGLTWRCSQPGLNIHPEHMHISLAAALTCGGIQAFFYLPLGSGMPPGVSMADGLVAPDGRPPLATV